MTEALSREARIAPAEIELWRTSEPALSGDFATDRAAFAMFWAQASRLIGHLPAPSQRQDADRKTARVILEQARPSRVKFLRQHIDAIYDELTGKLTHDAPTTE